MEPSQQVRPKDMNGKRHSLMKLPPEIRNQIWELLVLSEGDVLIEDSCGGPRGSRPALLKVCHQIDKEASLIFWGRNVFALKDYRLSHFVDDWGWRALRSVKIFKLVWSADSMARLDDLECDQAYTEDFNGLETLEPWTTSTSRQSYPGIPSG
jgi:hypothetical protein